MNVVSNLERVALIRNLSMFEKELIIDGRGHLLEGRLASIVSKELLSGQRVTVVRCELILKSAWIKRNEITFARASSDWLSLLTEITRRAIWMRRQASSQSLASFT